MGSPGSYSTSPWGRSTRRRCGRRRARAAAGEAGQEGRAAGAGGVDRRQTGTAAPGTWASSLLRTRRAVVARDAGGRRPRMGRRPGCTRCPSESPSPGYVKHTPPGPPRRRTGVRRRYGEATVGGLTARRRRPTLGARGVTTRAPGSTPRTRSTPCSSPTATRWRGPPPPGAAAGRASVGPANGAGRVSLRMHPKAPGLFAPCRCDRPLRTTADKEERPHPRPGRMLRRRCAGRSRGAAARPCYKTPQRRIAPVRWSAAVVLVGSLPRKRKGEAWLIHHDPRH